MLINGYIIAPVVHSHTIILSHMTTTPDAMDRRLPGPPSPPTETTTSLDSLPPMPPGQDHCLLALGCHLIWFFPLTIFPHRGFLEGFFPWTCWPHVLNKLCFQLAHPSVVVLVHSVDLDTF